jgi:hypothetical protein
MDNNRGPHGYAAYAMNISIMNLTDMNTIIFLWIISADISMLLKFYEYEYGYALNIHIFMDIVCVIDFFIVASGADIQGT